MMKNREFLFGVIIKLLFVVFTFCILLYFICGEMLYPKETDPLDEYYVEYDEGWMQVMPDGSRKSIEVPGSYEADENNIFIAETLLPNQVDDDDWICFRTSKQDAEIYVGDELRKSYSTKDLRPYGDFSVSSYVFVDLNTSDSGAKVTYKAWSNDRSHAGLLHNVHYGDRFAIWYHLFVIGGIDTILIFTLMIIGFLGIVGIVILNIKYKKNIEIEFLCWGVILIAVWLLGQSNIRQLFFSNVTLANSMTYFSIMIVPVPFLIYVDEIQKHRYTKLHMFMSAILMLNFVFCSYLQFANIRNLMDMSVLIFTVIIMAFLGIIYTFVKDMVKGYDREYWLVIIGFFGGIAGALLQMYSFFNEVGLRESTYISLGVVFLLLMATIKAVKDILKIESQNKEVVLSNNSRTKLLAGISKEIKTSAYTIMDIDETLIKEGSESEIREYILGIKNAGKNILNLIDDALDVSNVGMETLVLKEDKYRVYQLIDSCYTKINTLAQQKGIEIKITNESDMPGVLIGDNARIQQIISSLLIYCIKHAKEGNVTLKIGCRCLDDKNVILGITVSGKDSTNNIDDFKEIFENKDTYIDYDTYGIDGMRLGIVGKLVGMMNGTISAYNEYDGDSIFTVFIPQKVASSESVGVYEIKES